MKGVPPWAADPEDEIGFLTAVPEVPELLRDELTVGARRPASS
jgi:hypothetical protein